MTDQEQQDTLSNLSNQNTIETDNHETEQQQAIEMKENESITNSPTKSRFSHLTASTKTSPIPKPLINPIGDLKSSFNNAFTTPISLKTKSYMNSNSILMSPTNTPNSTNTFNTINESQISRKQKVQALMESRSKAINNQLNELSTNNQSIDDNDNLNSSSKLNSKDRLNELLNRKQFNGGILLSNSSLEGSNESKSSTANSNDKRSGLLADIMRRQASSTGLGSSIGIASMIGPGSGQGLGPGLGPGQGSGLGYGQGSGLGYGQGSGLGPGQGSGLGYGQGSGLG
eukprot:CAMPEP_0196763670 /NCGR_PEP_ID=MMETSP1095-20130614/4489_1 /TAXON_ID=96789 ORGANISM="Chromulina nebulosa, Strain UTEXLB2642" /NCGR_SAMPLE_ID=MMETSP1095 /ASSEMBLY_ACC=CAM_ASM_000446 /LENGTH=285 /DNA_ID=CAMNT_0042117317 /DNA_START=497 /DNA_END=1351 /DNA_ORIENTATION=+